MRAACVALSILLLACGHHGTGPGGGMDGGGDHGALTALAVTPGTAMLAMAPDGASYAAYRTFVATATYADGATADVSATATWMGDDASVLWQGPAAKFTAAGVYHVSAAYGGQAGTATATVTLDATGLGSGFDPGDQGKLDGTPDPAQVPAIAYPLAGALVPVNVAPIEVHAQKSDPSQALARIDLTSGALLTYHYYAPCAPSPNPAQFPDACIVSLTGAFAAQLAGVSEQADVQLAVRLVAADGTKLGASQPISLAWSRTALTGGLYYWTTAGTGDTTFNTAIARYDFAGDASKPEIYLSSADAPAVPNGQPQCIGCHALSPDGTKLSFSLGGSLPGYFSLYDVASRTATASDFDDKFAIMSTFSPDASREITAAYGALTLRQADATLAPIQSNLFASAISESLSQPAWSADGAQFAFVSWVPSSADQTSGHVTGDMVQGAQIWIAPSDGTQITGAAALLVPRATGVTSYYPAISDDDHFVVFNQSDCAGPANSPAGWGAGACDGYNDISARLFVVPSAGGTPIALTNANGGDAPLTTNSWPRWSPDHGTFRGKTLYWVAFSSRRAYGLALPSGTGADTTKPQLWFAAIAVDPGAALTADPSFAPVWLPGQDPDLSGPRGNHTPAWTSRAVPIQ